MTQSFRSMLVILLAGALLCLTGNGAAHAQGKNSGTYLAAAFTRVTDNANLAKRLNGYGYNEGISIVGGWINAGSHMTFTWSLREGTTYQLLGAGDKDAEDVDLEIYDQDGQKLVSDNRVAPDAVVEFVPPADGKYTMKLILYKARNNVPCVCIATLLKKGGWNVPLQNLDNVASKLIQALTVADEELQRKTGKRFDFRRAKNQWAVYGSVLREGQTVSVINMDLGTGLRGFIAVGDKKAEDVDLFLLDVNGQTVAQDVRTDPVATFVRDPGALGDDGPHELRIRNYKSSGPAVVMMSVFDVR